MARRTVYLAGTISGLTYGQASGPRDYAANLLLKRGWDVLDPMRGYQILSTLGDTPISEGQEVKSMLGITDTAITQRDRDDIRRSDVLLVFSGNAATWGTGFEWEFAFNLGKPIVIICDEDSPTRNHPWCRTMCSGFVSSVDEAVEFIDRWLDRGYQLGDEG